MPVRAAAVRGPPHPPTPPPPHPPHPRPPPPPPPMAPLGKRIVFCQQRAVESDTTSAIGVLKVLLNRSAVAGLSLAWRKIVIDDGLDPNRQSTRLRIFIGQCSRVPNCSQIEPGGMTMVFRRANAAIKILSALEIGRYEHVPSHARGCRDRRASAGAGADGMLAGPAYPFDLIGDRSSQGRIHRLGGGGDLWRHCGQGELVHPRSPSQIVRPAFPAWCSLPSRQAITTSAHGVSPAFHQHRKSRPCGIIHQPDSFADGDGAVCGGRSSPSSTTSGSRAVYGPETSTAFRDRAERRQGQRHPGTQWL